MKYLTALIILAMPQALQARTELHYFTGKDCTPCKPVTQIVNALNAQGRDIEVHVWEQNQAPFKYYDVSFMPAFVTVRDGKKVGHYVQENKPGGFRFTASFISGLAPQRAVELDQPPRDCANPIGRPFKNLIPPPPAPGLPKDVPDRVKVKRIEDLEKMINDLKLSVSVLRAEIADLESGKDGKQGPAGPAGPAGRDADAMPISVRIDVVNDAGTVVSTKTQTYPRGTPVVLRFHEKLLAVQE